MAIMICMLLDRLLHTSSLLLNFYRNVSVTLKVSSDTTKLPDPCGPLPTTVPSSSIESANAEVKQVIETEESSDRRKRGHCEKFSPEQRFQIGKHAAKNGVAETMCFYAKKFVLNESSIERGRTPTPERFIQSEVTSQPTITPDLTTATANRSR